jgi:diguanylate cyclase (GGDEF)-like protein
VTIDFDNFVNVLRLDELGDNGFIYELSYIDRDDNIHIMKNNGVPAADAVSLRFPVRNLLWEISISPVNGWYSMGKVVFVSIVILAVAIFASLFTNVVCRLRKANIVLSRLSNTDKLTGCENRRAFEEMIARYETVGYSPDFVYVSADVNGLKTVNDNLGHKAGDEIICGAAECLKDVLSAFGHVYRTGGDEFVALIFAKEEAVLLLKDEIINRVEKWRGDYVHTMSISMGFASKREFPDSSISELAVISDRRMYEDKKTYYSKSGISVHSGSYVYERMP